MFSVDGPKKFGHHHLKLFVYVNSVNGKKENLKIYILCNGFLYNLHSESVISLKSHTLN